MTERQKPESITEEQTMRKARELIFDIAQLNLSDPSLSETKKDSTIKWAEKELGKIDLSD